MKGKKTKNAQQHLIDPSTLGKIERGERSANKEMIPILAELFGIEEKNLGLILFSDKVAYHN